MLESYNVVTGYRVGFFLSHGRENVFTGFMTGASTQDGASNTFLGKSAGYYNISSGGYAFTGT